MAAFDTPITPVAVTPSDENPTEIYTTAASAMLFVDISNKTSSPIKVWFGLTPSGGSVHWKLTEFSLPANDSLLQLGPYPVPTDTEVTGMTDTGDVAEFSVTGTVTT